MGVTFRIVKYSITPGVELVEILSGGNVVGAIYPNGETSRIKIVSAHFFEKTIPTHFDGEVVEDNGDESSPPIPAVEITFKPRRYVIVNREIIYIK